jgi:hypothetical protein
MDSSMMDKFKAMNRPERETSEAEGIPLEITLKLEEILKEMGGLTVETKRTLDSSAAVLMSVDIILDQIKTLTEKVNELYVQMKGADKDGIKTSRKTFIKGILIGVLVGMAAWLVIAIVLK